LIKAEVKRLWLRCATSHGESEQVRTATANHFRNHAISIAIPIKQGWQAARLSGKTVYNRTGPRQHNVTRQRFKMTR
jgi:hypothetical protein